MEYKKVKPEEVPKKKGRSGSKFETTPVWAELKKDLDRGWKGDDVLEVIVSASDLAKLGLSNRRTVPRFIERYIEQNELAYTIKTVLRGDVDVIIIHKAA